MNIQESFWNATPEEMKNGYIEQKDFFLCLLCGKKIEKGIIYPTDDVLYEASRYIELHIKKEHGSVFESLLGLDKRYSGLSDHQSKLLRLFYQGLPDSDIQKATGIGSASTIRNHRFALREKERQSRVFLTLMELLKEKDNNRAEDIDVPIQAQIMDERYNVTPSEKDKILHRCFPDGTTGRLSVFPAREKQKLIVLQEVMKRFEPGNTYNEKEVNTIIEAIYDDYVTLRRYLVEYGFLDRIADGSQYWVKE